MEKTGNRGPFPLSYFYIIEIDEMEKGKQKKEWKIKKGGTGGKMRIKIKDWLKFVFWTQHAYLALRWSGTANIGYFNIIIIWHNHNNYIKY